MHETLLARWNAISLRSKITGVTVLLLAFGLLVSGVGTMALLRPKLVDQLDAQLKSAASRNFSNYAQQNPRSSILEAKSTDTDYFVAFLDSRGRLVWHNWPDQPTEQLPVLPTNIDVSTSFALGDVPFALQSPSGRVHYHAVVTPATTTGGPEMFTLLVATSTHPVDSVMTTYLTVFLGFGLGVIVLGALLTRLLVISAFKPLRNVERTAARIADGDFSQRLDSATPNTEVGRLNRSLNTMLNRIDSAFKDRAKTIEQMRRFVGDASHELRTPLVSVRGYAELNRMGALRTRKEVAQAMERIEKEAIRMGELVEDLLELARLDETKPLELAPVDLLPIANDASLDAKASAPLRTITVVPTSIDATSVSAADTHAATPPLSASRENTTGESPSTPGDSTGHIANGSARFARLRYKKPRRVNAQSNANERSITPEGDASHPVFDTPLSSPSAIVLAEENKLRQVVSNLLGNAIRFTPSESPIEIAVGSNSADNTGTLSIIDHGDGIPPQVREKIFQRFWRADSSRARETGGTGLGLAIVASIVAAHNGSVTVTETPGGGATFRVALPLAPNPHGSVAASPNATTAKPN